MSAFKNRRLFLLWSLTHQTISCKKPHRNSFFFSSWWDYFSRPLLCLHNSNKSLPSTSASSTVVKWPLAIRRWDRIYLQFPDCIEKNSTITLLIVYPSSENHQLCLSNVKLKYPPETGTFLPLGRSFQLHVAKDETKATSQIDVEIHHVHLTFSTITELFL